jgi:hypothetical protein
MSKTTETLPVKNRITRSWKAKLTAMTAATFAMMLGLAIPAQARGTIGPVPLNPGGACTASNITGKSWVSGSKAYASTTKSGGACILSSPKTWVSANSSSGTSGKKSNYEKYIEKSTSGKNGVWGWHSYGNNSGIAS